VKILIVDDDRELVELLSFALNRAGLIPLGAYDTPVAMRILEQEQPDLVVLDINLGAWNGLELLADLRRRRGIPVIMLTGKGSEDDKVLGLELGADDYITKPFSHRELIARIRAQLRRHGQEALTPLPSGPILRAGPITVNTAQHVVAKDGQLLSLTVTEFRLLHHLIINAGLVVPSQSLLKQVWGYEDAEGTDVLRVALHRLRRKLGDDSARPRLLHTIPGIGVMLKPVAGETAPEALERRA
jgi:two-component system response regulator VicR